MKIHSLCLGLVFSLGLAQAGTKGVGNGADGLFLTGENLEVMLLDFVEDEHFEEKLLQALTNYYQKGKGSGKIHTVSPHTLPELKKYLDPLKALLGTKLPGLGKDIAQHLDKIEWAFVTGDDLPELDDEGIIAPDFVRPDLLKKQLAIQFNDVVMINDKLYRAMVNDKHQAGVWLHEILIHIQKQQQMVIPKYIRAANRTVFSTLEKEMSSDELAQKMSEFQIGDYQTQNEVYRIQQQQRLNQLNKKIRERVSTSWQKLSSRERECFSVSDRERLMARAFADTDYSRLDGAYTVSPEIARETFLKITFTSLAASSTYRRSKEQDCPGLLSDALLISMHPRSSQGFRWDAQVWSDVAQASGFHQQIYFSPSSDTGYYQHNYRGPNQDLAAVANSPINEIFNSPEYSQYFGKTGKSVEEKITEIVSRMKQKPSASVNKISAYVNSNFHGYCAKNIFEIWDTAHFEHIKFRRNVRQTVSPACLAQAISSLR